MLAFDVVRSDWSDALLDRAFRRGLVLLPAGDRSVRFYPRYDMEPSAIDEALAILRLAIGDLVRGRVVPETMPPPRRRVGTLEIPLDTIETADIARQAFDAVKLQILAVEQERYGGAPVAPDGPPDTHRTLLQYPLGALESTATAARAVGIGLRDRVSGRFVGYALGSALEDHDEEGVASDPRFGENNTFYLQAIAILPTVQNAVELENHALDLIRDRAAAAGFEFLSTLIEDRVRETGPEWLRTAAVIDRFDNYLGSGMPFAYLQASLAAAA
jgi:hypothetical protein